MTPYRIPSAAVVFEQVIKGSRFICHLGPAASARKARAEIESIRNSYPKANHVCWAYIAGAPDSSERCMNNAGEPHGTAGKPMLSILSHSGYGEIWTTVTRYFGVIKLGTSGLVRAYGSTVRQALELVTPLIRQKTLPGRIMIDYHIWPLLEPVLAEEKVETIDCTYAEKIILDARVPESRCRTLQCRLQGISGGRCCFSPIPDAL